MKLTEMQLYSALNEYIDREIMPLGANMKMLEQFMFGVQIGVIKRKIQSVVKSYINSPAIKALGLIDENGLIDIDTIYNAAADTFKQMSYIEVGGVRLSEPDLQKLYGTMRKYDNNTSHMRNEENATI